MRASETEATGAQLARTLHIKRDDLSGAQVRALLAEHLRDMHELSPPESVHALDIGALLQPDVTFWTVWSGTQLLGCAALRELTATHGEIKSMRTSRRHRRRGVGKAMLEHIIREARARAYERLSLETGAMKAFEPAQKLYESYGFTYCAPFAGYVPDPSSVFMTKRLNDDAPNGYG